MTSEEKWVNANGEPQIPREFLDQLVAVRSPNFQPNPKLFCVICSTGNHHSHECRRYKSSKEFWEKVLQDRRCKNCLRFYHRSDRCFNKSFCNIVGCNRRDKHSPVLCFVRYRRKSPTLQYKNWQVNPPYCRDRFYYSPRSWGQKSRKSSLSFNKVISPNGARCNSVSVSSQTDPPDVNATLKKDCSTQTEGSCDQQQVSESCQTTHSLASTGIQTLVQISPSIDIFTDLPPTEGPPLVPYQPSKVNEEENSSPCSNRLNDEDEIECLMGNLKVNVPSETSFHTSRESARMNNSSEAQIQVSSFPNFIRSAVDRYTHSVSKVLEQQPTGFSSFPHWK